MNTFSDSAGTALQLILSGDAGLWAIVLRSLAVSATACLLACSLGLALGAWLGVSRFAGRGVVLTLLNTFLAVPAVVVGLVVYLLLSRSGPLGFLGWLFSFQAMVLAQAILVLPLVTALTRQVVEDVDRNSEGFTRVMTTAIALETSKGDLPLALGLGIVLLAVVLLLNSLVALLRRWREHLDGGDLRMATT